jgi:thiol-disulfide isomerase/thioredoxin
MVILVLCLGGCREQTVRLDAPAPELSALNAVTGETETLSRWRGTPVLLIFWSAGCGTCVAGLPDLEALSRQYKGKAQIVAVNIDPDVVDIHPLLHRTRLTLPVIRDPLGITRERYLVQAVPAAHFIDAGGILRRSFIGVPDRGEVAALFDML